MKEWSRVVKTGLPLKNKGAIFTRDCEDTLTSIHCTTTFFSTSLCGVLVFDSVPVPPPSHLLLRPLFDTHNFVTHHLSHTTLSHNTLSHTIFHTHNFVTHNFVTHTIFHTQLCHTPFFNFVTHTIFHTTLSHTIFHTHNFVIWRGRRGTGCTWLALVARLVAVGRRWSPGAPRHFAWQAWHFVTSTFVHFETFTCVWRGRRGTCCTWLPLTFHLRGRRDIWRHLPAFGVAGVALVALGCHERSMCVAGVALDDIDVPFAWQAWHLATFTCVWHGRRGTWRHLLVFGVARVALVALAQLSHNLFHTQLCNSLFHTPSFTHFLSDSLSHTTFTQTVFHTQLCHTPAFLSHTIFHTQLCHTQLFTYNNFYFSILHHLLCLSFLPRPATTFVTHYWKKLGLPWVTMVKLI